MQITLAQINPTVGAITQNYQKIFEQYSQACKQKDDLIVFPELAITGYPPEDLVLRPYIQQQAMFHIEKLAFCTARKHTAMLVGGIHVRGNALYNAAFLLEDGKIAQIVHKFRLPNYGVFDEIRVFSRGGTPRPILFRGSSLGVLICEDMWEVDLARALAKQGAEMLITLNASPYEKQKQELRYKLARRCVQHTKLPLMYVNQVGGQDELVFDGHSFVITAEDDLAHSLPMWEESSLTTNWTKKSDGWQCKSSRSKKHIKEMPLPDTEEAMYLALVTGLKDYIAKNHFPGVIIGLSGGIDSALTAAIAVDALGAKNVQAVMMPSRFTSEESKRDAKECAEALGITLNEIDIMPMVEGFNAAIEPHCKHIPALAQENIQSRVRGNILMSLSNSTGAMVVATGNKSEMATGYTTLYGDLCGGFAVLKDVYKTEVVSLCHWRNSQKPKHALGPKGEVIPENIITKPPTAELRENQKDSDSLPPYDILDDILYQFIELRRSTKEIIDNGHGEQTVNQVKELIFKAEYKRRQAPPGVKVSSVAFGKDYRYPITNGA